MCAILTLAGGNDAMGRGRGGYNSRAAAAAVKAQRARMISTLQKQVANAKQVLEQAESQTQMSQAQVTAATSKLAGIREEIDNTQHDVAEASKALRGIETELIAHQQADSEYSKAQKSVEDLKVAVHEVIHQILNLPDHELEAGADPRKEDLKLLSTNQLDQLQRSQSYLDAEKNLKDATQNVSRIRQKLFQDDSEWVAAHDDLVNANRNKLEGEKERRATGAVAAGSRLDLQNARGVAQAARTVIAQGEFRLRQLGASLPQQKSSTSSDPKAPKK